MKEAMTHVWSNGSSRKGARLFTARSLVLTALLAVLAIATCPAALAQDTSATDEMHAGEVAYKFSDYAGAAEHFKAALAINPDLTPARLFLATAYAQQYIPGDESEANVGMAQQAIDEFKKVLNDDPSDQERYKSLVPLASLSFNMKRLGDARDYYGKVLELKPDDARGYFMLGLIDWTEASKSRAKVKGELGLTEGQLISKPEDCISLRAENQQKVEDGIQRLQKALELQADYDDAMGYLNLLYRERAEYECDDPEARKADLKAADEWTDKAIAAKKAKTESTTAEKPAPKDP
jgi:tetratricopeptide (TPR) repeat protein